MSSDDKTRILPDEKKFDTQPMLEAILERLSVLTQEVKGLRADMEKGFQMVNKRLDILSANFNQLQAHQQVLEDRVDKLEQKPS